MKIMTSSLLYVAIATSKMYLKAGLSQNLTCIAKCNAEPFQHRED